MPKHDRDESSSHGKHEKKRHKRSRSRSSSYERKHRKHDHKDKHHHEHRGHHGSEKRKHAESDRGRERHSSEEVKPLSKHEDFVKKERDSPKAEIKSEARLREPFPEEKKPRREVSVEEAAELAAQPVAAEKEKPSLALSGNLLKDTNTFRGVVIKYAEPADSHQPSTNRRYRLYPFKGDTELPCLYIHRQSAYLIGRDRQIADLPVDHPSCSKQHAVIQYRLVNESSDDTVSKFARRVIKPYIIDLESANGTYLNEDRIEARRFYELRDKDVVRFGFSTRSYVVLSETFNDQGDKISGDEAGTP